MKVVILAGGMGTRLAEETDIKPKPMVEIGGRPILWHIMQHYSAYGYNEFVICLGYKGEYIKRYMLDYAKLTSDLTVKIRSGDVMRHGSGMKCDWTVDLVDTGLQTATGGRVKRVQQYVGNQTFMLTYGDGVSDVNIHKLLEFHRKHGKLATLTAVRPPARFGHMHFEGDLITQFSEKPQTESGWINGGFFVMEPAVFDLIGGDDTWLERETLEILASRKQLCAYKHEGFWQCMDTLRDKRLLEDLWAKGQAPWKVG
ncbi:glucose-1-phosphate cytidylyltransferase [Fontivita pretiosa]|uniref:glucose-1-phosphate cytidylyltransferase n=1 Tax=Fontivita pretiosa TaxID=2989684 RepID=UPI003D169BBA